MSKKKVITWKNLPPRSPVLLTWVAALSHSVWDIPEWGWGLMWGLIALIWVGVIVEFFQCENVDIFKEDK